MENKVKILAMYLPQFHRVPENDMWWGDGFTDWVSTKNAKPLYDGHYQPHVPQNGNAYDLTDKNTMQWQADLLNKYGVDGVCIYHYWFKNGRQILEKPAENLLQWTDVDMPYCFCWANETWARSWSNVPNKNVWANTYESKVDVSTNGILLEQCYGDEQSWKKHFEYLLPFFKDDRYIKIDGCPVFVIYKTADIPCLTEMLAYWNELSKQVGIKGLYIVGANCNSAKQMGIHAKLRHQPSGSLNKLQTTEKRLQNQVCLWEYDEVWNQLLSEVPEEKMFFEGFVGYDDTPRRGVEGTVIGNASPDKFEQYVSQLIAKSIVYGNELVFLNAWNEWGEGMHLEPDEKYGEQFLAAISEAKKNYKIYVEKYQCEKENHVRNVQMIELQRLADRNTEYMNLLDRWMFLRKDNKSVVEWLLQHGYKRVAIYGYGVLGKHLYAELESSSVQVDYVMDRRRDKIHVNTAVYALSDELPETDVVLVSIPYYFSEVFTQLREKGIKNIVSLATVLNEM